jgi:hypothetical protein
MANTPRNAPPSMPEATSPPLVELEQLRAENEQLRAQLAGVRTGIVRPANPEPRFELSAGEQSDLQLNGVTRSVRTGRTIFADDYPDHIDESALSEQARANMAAARKA